MTVRRILLLYSDSDPLPAPALPMLIPQCPPPLSAASPPALVEGRKGGNHLKARPSHCSDDDVSGRWGGIPHCCGSAGPAGFPSRAHPRF